MTNQAIDQLLHEHRTIERLLGVLDRVADRLDSNLDVPIDLFPGILEFSRVFTDDCHHTKEEKVLFPAMESHGVASSTGPIGVMLAEHDLGRRYINALAEAARHYAQDSAASGATLAQSARGYATLVRQHIHKEDTVLYPMAIALLSESEMEAVRQQFEALERDRLGPGEHERLQRLADQLAAQVPH